MYGLAGKKRLRFYGSCPRFLNLCALKKIVKTRAYTEPKMCLLFPFLLLYYLHRRASIYFLYNNVIDYYLELHMLHYSYEL